MSAMEQTFSSTATKELEEWESYVEYAGSAGSRVIGLPIVRGMRAPCRCGFKRYRGVDA
jgi:hypothetical protein